MFLYLWLMLLNSDFITWQNKALWVPALVPILSNPLAWSLKMLNTLLLTPITIPKDPLISSVKIRKISTKYCHDNNPFPKDLNTPEQVQEETEVQRSLAKQVHQAKDIPALRHSVCLSPPSNGSECWLWCTSFKLCWKQVNGWTLKCGLFWIQTFRKGMCASSY